VPIRYLRCFRTLPDSGSITRAGGKSGVAAAISEEQVWPSGPCPLVRPRCVVTIGIKLPKRQNRKTGSHPFGRSQHPSWRRAVETARLEAGEQALATKEAPPPPARRPAQLSRRRQRPSPAEARWVMRREPGLCPRLCRRCARYRQTAGSYRVKYQPALALRHQAVYGSHVGNISRRYRHPPAPTRKRTPTATRPLRRAEQT
jgi:hypothetical protein